MRQVVSWPLLVILAVAFTLRAACALTICNAQYSDSVWYDDAARRLLQEGEYGPVQASAWFPPGYPLFLAGVYQVFGSSQLAGKFANVVLEVLACALVYGLGNSFFGRPVGLIASLLLAVWPNVIFHVCILSSEPLALFGFAVTFWLGTWPEQVPQARSVSEGQRNPSLALRAFAGVVLGWTILTRPVAGILWPALVLHRWLETRSFTRAIGFGVPVLLGAALLVSGWSLRNYLRFGELIPIATNGGYNFWQANHRFADGNDSFWSRVPLDDPEYRTMKEADEWTRNREGYRYGRNFLLSHPERWVKSIPTKVFWLFHTDTSGLYEAVLYAPELTPSSVADWIKDHARRVESLTFRYYQVLVVLALAGVVCVPAECRWRVWPLLSLLFLLIGFHLFFHAKDRFHVPLAPFIALLAAIPIGKGGQWLKRNSLVFISAQRMSS